jgi:polysaccharide biosynthesis protein PslF
VAGLVDGPDRLVGTGHEKAGGSMVDDLGHGTPVVGYHRGAAGHRFHHTEAERLVETDEVEQGMGPAENLDAVSGVDRTDEAHLAVIEVREDLGVEVALILDDAGDHQRPTRSAGYLDGLSGALVGMDPSEEQEVSARLVAEGELADRDPMVDGGGIAEPGMAVGVADGDVAVGGVVTLVDGHDPLRREPVDRGDHRGGDQLAVGEGKEVEPVVDHVELVGPLEHGGDVEALGHLRFDRRVLRPARRGGGGQLGRCDRIGGGEQGDVMAPLNESFGEERSKQLPRPVVAGWGAPGNRRQDGDPQRSVVGCLEGGGYGADGSDVWATNNEGTVGATPWKSAPGLGRTTVFGCVALRRFCALTEPTLELRHMSRPYRPASSGPASSGPASSSPVGPARRFGMLSTFPPTECGIATFAAALSAGLIASGDSVDVVRIGASPAVEDASVVACTGDDQGASNEAAVDALNSTDVAIVQHEYGIYAAPDGLDVAGLVESLVVPTIVVAHTVLAQPTAAQRDVLARICAGADAVVVMTATARDRLIARFGVPGSNVTVIAHGAAVPASADCTEDRPAHQAPRLLTWGLLGPGKGIEWAIDALGLLGDLAPAPRYVIAGATHPKVLAHSGERYRSMLRHRADLSPAASCVSFDATYRDLHALNDLIRSADVVVLPYDSKDQVTSGVLVDAVAAGRPVVSTAFPHAVELLASGAGIVVPQRDPVALAGAIRAVLGEPGLASSMAAEARRLAPGLSWTAVAGQYGTLAQGLLDDRYPVRA